MTSSELNKLKARVKGKHDIRALKSVNGQVTMIGLAKNGYIKLMSPKRFMARFNLARTQDG